MDIHTLIRSEKDSISIPELRKMLGIGKTESYWLIQNRGIKTFQLRGCMRVRNKDFWDWYDNQTKHRLLQGPPPGRALQETSYSVREAILNQQNSDRGQVNKDRYFFSFGARRLRCKSSMSIPAHNIAARLNRNRGA